MPPLAFSLQVPLRAAPGSPSLPPPSRRPPCLHRRAPRAVVQVGSEPFRADSIPAVGQARFIDPALSFRARAARLAADGALPSRTVDTLTHWFDSYRQAAEDNATFAGDPDAYTEAMFSTLLELARRSVATPIDFEPYHARIRAPFDYYKFGFDFASMLLNAAESSVVGSENVAEAANLVHQGHNVVFLSNHQSEGDPYAIDSMLDWVAGCDREFCENIIFMAGDRVRKDPVVAPFSAGRNLLTVYSKKHINDEPELKEEKLLHNRRTIATTAKLFKHGGKVVWFAPSGGRDRRNMDTSLVELSDFDEGAVDMMRFTALKSGVPTHFYPMALWTYDMLPPPTSVGGSEIGEERVVNHIPMHMCVGKELDWDAAPEAPDKMGRRKARCEYAQQAVEDAYRVIGGFER